MTCNIADASSPTDLTLGELLSALSEHGATPLVFVYGGRMVQTGYHVTEVKAGRFAGLDCGANPEAWTEIFVQLWDVRESEEHMPARKFSAILREVGRHVELDHGAKLTFEVSDGIEPMQLYRAERPRLLDGTIQVTLSARPATCKPRNLPLLDQASACRPASCCA